MKRNQRTRFVVAALLLIVISMLASSIAFASSTDTSSDVPAADEQTQALETVPEDEGTYSINFIDAIVSIAKSTGFASGQWRQYVMIGFACLLLYLAIVKEFEPLLLLPIAFGMLLANLPSAGLMADPTYKFFTTMDEAVAYATKASKPLSDIVMAYSEDLGQMAYRVPYANGGLLYYLYRGVKLGIYPPLIFMGVGAMTDFGPLLANPKSLLLGAAAQLGIFMTFIGAILLGFTPQEAGAIGIIGGADGPTAIFVTSKLAPHLLGPIAVAAYSYMALVPVIQPPIMKALTTRKERMIVMEQLRPVSKTELVIFPIVVTILVSLLLPDAASLVGLLMLGNLFRVSGVTERLNKTAQNELCNIVTIFLGVTVFSFGTAGGVLLAKLMNKLSGGKINPLIGSAGVSAVPMAARVSQSVGQKENPGNFLLMHAMGPNVAGVIGSAVAAGVFISLFG